MAKQDTASNPLPPYISLVTLKNFVQKLKETTVPPRIDGSVLKSYPGSTAAQLTAALRFLKLIQDSNATTPLLTKLVNHYETPGWAGTVKEVMIPAFKPIVQDLDLGTATYGMLREKFSNWGAEGEVLDKCVRFFESAMTESGMALSPHILNRPRAKPDRTKTKAKKVRGENGEGGDDGNDQDITPTAGTVRFSVPIPDKAPATLVLPSDLADEDWGMIDAMIRAYVARRQKAGK